MQLLYIGTTEIILIVALVLLLFGGKKIPELILTSSPEKQ